MEELEIGEYVRSKKGYIAKIKDIICKGYPIKSLEGYIICDDEDGTIINPNEVIKHSKNLIDLIEIGDIVNGYRILEMVNSIYKKSKRILIYKNEREKYERWIYIKEYDGKIHTQDDIKTILTKEQYMQNCYKVEEE